MNHITPKVVAIAASMMFAGAATASQIVINPAASGEPSIYQIAAGEDLNGNSVSTSLISDLGPGSPQTNNANWKIGATGTSTAKLFAQWAGNYSGASFGIYDPNNTSAMLQLLGSGNFGATTSNIKSELTLTGPGQFTTAQFDTGNNLFDLNPASATFTSDIFGFYFQLSSGTTYYSNPNLDPSQIARMVGFQGDGTGTFLSNEYLFGWEDGTDFDYNDYVVGVESIKPVPEPSSLMIFGLGLVGVGFAARRLRKRG